jgi:hypothetical protein
MHLALVLTLCLAADGIDDLIARGRALLDARKPQEAEAVFTAAAAQDHDSLRTRLWVLRAWMDQGRSNDTLDAIDALERSGTSGIEIDYLYGMAFLRRAEALMRQDVTDSALQLNIEEAFGRLRIVTAKDPLRFYDAFLPLAKAAWYSQENGAARAAAEAAVARAPEDPPAHLMLGRIALSQFSAAKGEAEPWPAEAEAHWSAARAAFLRVLELHRRPQDDAARAEAADAAVQLGHTLVWKALRAQAAEAFGTAMGLTPTGIDYAQVRGLLLAPLPTESGAVYDPGQDFLHALEKGAELCESTFGKSDLRDATLLWWLGYARYELRRKAPAEEAFRAALAKQPFANTWVYVAALRFDDQDVEGALAALREGWELDAPTVVSTLQYGQQSELAKVQGLADQLSQADPPRRLDAAFAWELCAEALPSHAPYWNNLGLFLRDAGDDLRQAKGQAADPALLADLFERAHRAYQRCIALEKDDPQYLNDAAVMLHYYLERDLEQALAMYDRARALAAALVEKDAFPSDEERARIQIALRDSTNNGNLLRKKLGREKGGAGGG